MNKRLLARLMHERMDGLHNSAGYFFRGDFEYVLQGVCFEYMPGGLYMWKFRFPLFDFFGPNLLYSSRFSEHGGFIAKGDMSEKAIVDFVMSSPEAQSVFGPARSEEVAEFVHFLESAPALLNPHAKLIHAAALVLAGPTFSASCALDELSPMLNGNDAAECKRLRTSLGHGLEAARALLDQVRQDNLRKLGIVV